MRARCLLVGGLALLGLRAMAALAALFVGLWQIVAGVAWIFARGGIDRLQLPAIVASGLILIGASLALAPLDGRGGPRVPRFIGVARAVNWLPVGMFASMAPPLQVGWWALQPLLAAGTPERLPGRALRFVLLVSAGFFLYEAARRAPTGVEGWAALARPDSGDEELVWSVLLALAATTAALTPPEPPRGPHRISLGLVALLTIVVAAGNLALTACLTWSAPPGEPFIVAYWARHSASVGFIAGVLLTGTHALSLVWPRPGAADRTGG